jgi:endoglucanase
VLPGVGHSGWNDVYNGTVTTDGKTIWDWLYQFDRSKTFSKLHITGTLEADASAATLSTTALASGGLHVEAEDYTQMYGVQTQTTADAGGGENVGWIDEHDWMKYNVSVATAGTYTLKLRLASNVSGAQFQLKNSSGTVLATINVPNTTGWQRWQDVTATVKLAGGTQTLQFYSVAPEIWNMNWFELSENAMLASTMDAGTWAYSGTHIEAEDFFDRSGVLTQLTRDFAGGDRNLFDIGQGDWVRYQLNTPAAGSYTLCFRVACDATGSQFQIKNSSGTVLTTVAVPNTNGWQTWRDVTAIVRLEAGMQTKFWLRKALLGRSQSSRCRHQTDAQEPTSLFSLSYRSSAV